MLSSAASRYSHQFCFHLYVFHPSTFWKGQSLQQLGTSQRTNKHYYFILLHNWKPLTLQIKKMLFYQVAMTDLRKTQFYGLLSVLHWKGNLEVIKHFLTTETWLQLLPNCNSKLAPSMWSQMVSAPPLQRNQLCSLAQSHSGKLPWLCIELSSRQIARAEL